MPTYTIHGQTVDGRLSNTNVVYANARAGTGTFGTDTTTTLYVGQEVPASYVCHESFVAFDTSVIPDGENVASVTLSLYGVDDQSATDFTVEARVHDWGASLDTGDWVAGASLGTKTLVASWATSGYTAGHNVFASLPEFAAAINTTGTTRLILCSSRMRDGTTPTGPEYVGFSQADAGGTSQDPVLTVVTTLVPAVTVEIAFDSPPGAASPSWTDVSDYVRELRTRRGRSRELNRYQAGECEFVLANQDRRFDPAYAAGPYYGTVLPMKRVRVTAIHDAVTHPVFDGFIDSWEQVYEHPQEATAVVRCTDAFKVFNAATLPTSAFVVEVLVEETDPGDVAAWWRFGEPAGSTRLLDAIAARDLGEIVGGPTLGVESLPINEPDAALEITDTQQAISGTFIAPAGAKALTIEFLFQGNASSAQGTLLSYMTADGRGITITAGPSGGGAVNFYLVSTAGAAATLASAAWNIYDSAMHHLAFVWDLDGDQLIYIDGVDRTSTAASNAGAGWAGVTTRLTLGQQSGTALGAVVGIYDELVIYDREITSTRLSLHNSAARIAWRGDAPGARINRIVNQIEWPAVLVEVGSGSGFEGRSVLQSATLGGNALEHMQKVAESEFGALFISRDGVLTMKARDLLIDQTSQATFGDGTGEWEYTELDLDYSDADIRNDVIVSRANGTSQRVENATSIAAYLRHSFSMEGLLHDDDELSRDAATAILAQYDDPALRVTHLRVEPTSANPDLFTEVLERELTEWVTVKRRPQNLGSAIEQVSVLEGIEHEISDLHWSTVFRLSPAFTTAFWELGTAGWGELGQTTYLYF